MSSTVKSSAGLAIVPSGASLAAEIRGVDLRSIGDAEFAAIHRAWLDHLVLLFRGQSLSDEDLIAFGLRVKHDGTYNSGGYLRAGVTPTDDPRDAPGTLHPLVCTHPETGRKCLYLGRRRNAYIEGLPLAESEGLLDEIWRYAERADLT